jgi:hypothetical protein
MTCFGKYVPDVVLPQQPTQDVFGNRLLEAYVRGNKH